MIPLSGLLNSWNKWQALSDSHKAANTSQDSQTSWGYITAKALTTQWELNNQKTLRNSTESQMVIILDSSYFSWWKHKCQPFLSEEERFFLLLDTLPHDRKKVVNSEINSNHFVLIHKSIYRPESHWAQSFVVPQCKTGEEDQRVLPSSPCFLTYWEKLV